MALRNFRYMILATPLFVAACGEGYEPQLTSEYFPYGNQRTAGSGVAYVLAKMMPEKELKLAPAKRAPAPVEETKEILEEIDAPKAKAEEASMEKLFDEALEK